MSTNTKLQTTDLILLDFGAKLDNYCSDMTRTVFLGKPPREIEKMYLATQKAQQVALDYLKNHKNKNFKPNEAAIMANNILEEKGFPPVPHGLGHGVGLQVHENPRLSTYTKDKLTEGSIVTVEPGIYIPSLGGIRIEDTVLITPDGIDILTTSPKELIVL